MSQPRLEIPADIKDCLEAEHCDDFPISRYYVSEQTRQLVKDIVRIRKLSNEMKKILCRDGCAGFFLTYSFQKSFKEFRCLSFF